MDEKKKKKSKFPVILVLILLVGSIIWLSLVTIREDLTFEVNEEIKLEELIETSYLTTLNNKDEFLDTTTVGKKDVTLNLRWFFIDINKKVQIEVVDTTSPTLSSETYFIIKDGSTLEDLKAKLNAQDNSNANVDIYIDGDYNLDKAGKYSIKATAIDGSNNSTSSNYTFIVEIKSVNDSDATYFTTKNNFLSYVKDGLTFVDGTLIVNKSYSFTSDYYTDLYEDFKLAYNEMKADIEEAGLDIWIQSGHRTNDFQTYLYNNSKNKYGQELADIKTARPNHSEHESGLAADFNLVAQSFKYTDLYAWLQENCYKYGFVLRYVEGKTDETGYEFEPWHYRYVGKELAEILYNNGDWLTIEGYFGLDSVYDD